MTPEKSPLSTAHPGLSRPRKLLLSLLERGHGMAGAQRRYRVWQAKLPTSAGSEMNELLAACGISLRLVGQWPPAGLRERPLVIIANHPFGVPDGIATLALAERLGRPAKILINADLLRIPEIRRFSLPVDFSETHAAQRINAASAREAIARLGAGETIVIFPSGGIATASWPFGRAGDLPWKNFVAKLVQRTEADVLALYFPGQNSPLFHLASQVSMFWRLSLVVPEALRWIGREIVVRVGPVIPYETLAPLTDKSALTSLLRHRVFALAPGGVARDREGRIRAMRGSG